MVKYKRTAITSKQGINFVRSVVEDNGSLFHKVEHENDLGIDGVIEFIRGEQPLHQMIAVQIKSGGSFYNRATRECQIPVEGHREYWLKYSLPIVGMVYVPALKCAYWINLKRYLEDNTKATAIKFVADRANQFNHSRFNTVFVPSVLGEAAHLPIEEAVSLLESDSADERLLGLRVAFRRYPNLRHTWDAMVELFLSRPRGDLPGLLIYFFAHVPWHGDIFGFGEQLSKDTRDYAQSLFDSFGEPEVVKLLAFIDEDTMISRGSLGQSVEAVVSTLKSGIQLCGQIANDESITMFARECAALIFAMHRGKEALPVLELLRAQNSSYAEQMINTIKEFGGIYPYG